jgi:uncharacterized Fe-S cluster-containing radical SAM superfamily protein
MTQKSIDTEKFSAALRSRGVDLENKKVLLTRFAGSLQAGDLSLPPNCQGWGRIHHFRRSQGDGWPDNPLPLDPASRWLNSEYLDSVEAQVFQNAICSWRCWYCFVDFKLLSADPRYSDFKTVDEILDLYLAEPSRPRIVDLSGGQPDLVPEWVSWFLDAVERRGLAREIFVWSDDNLSNDYLWRYLSKADIRRLASFPNYGRVGCFKGFDERSFAFNTGASPDLFGQQFDLMARIVRAGFSVYGYATFTSDDDRFIPQKMRDFVDRLQVQVHELFPLRTIPLRIHEFTPTKSRMSQSNNRAVQIQWLAVRAWQEEIERRYSREARALRIFEHDLGVDS